MQWGWVAQAPPDSDCDRTAEDSSRSLPSISRHRLRELCVKLMFLHPVDYGRKAEELLWRKVYYEVIQLIKTNKKAGSCSSKVGLEQPGSFACSGP